jgi:hypothetical protein
MAAPQAETVAGRSEESAFKPVTRNMTAEVLLMVMETYNQERDPSASGKTRSASTQAGCCIVSMYLTGFSTRRNSPELPFSIDSNLSDAPGIGTCLNHCRQLWQHARQQSTDAV